MRHNHKVKYVYMRLSPEGARQALYALGDVLELLQLPSSVTSWPAFNPRCAGLLRLLALLLERSLDEIDQLPFNWASASGSIYKIHPRKFPK